MKSPPSPAGMRQLPGGSFLMGSARFYPEERPVRRVQVDPFWIDETPVTGAAFAAFVQDTGYLTLAERTAPGLPAPGSAVFALLCEDGDAGTSSRGWQFRPGACWRHPLGPGSHVDQVLDHPVVHVALQDALAYAAWAGKQLPTEAQWEYAARGGLDAADYAWGNALAPEGRMLANYWQGDFPLHNTLEDGWEGTSPVKSFPANGWELFDMIGNVWEWTQDSWSLPAQSQSGGSSCCQGSPSADASALKVIKGGSHLCALNYCQRFRPAARHPQPAHETTSHIGFRCVLASAPVPAA